MESYHTVSTSLGQNSVSCLWVEVGTQKDIGLVKNIAASTEMDVIPVVGNARLIEGVFETGFQKVAFHASAVPSIRTHLETLRKNNYSVYLCTSFYEGRVPDEKIFRSSVNQIAGALYSLKTNGLHNLNVQVYHPDPVIHHSINKFFKESYDTVNIIGFIPYDKSEDILIKSSLSVGIILYEHIGDAVLVRFPPGASFTVKRIAIAVSQVKKILGQCGLYPQGYTVIACPVCGRCMLDILKMTEQVSRKLQTLEKKYTPEWKKLEAAGGITVAVMGCNVNGPGEARQADIGIAGGKGNTGTIFKRGKPVSTLSEKKLFGRFEHELEELIREKMGLYSRL